MKPPSASASPPLLPLLFLVLISFFTSTSSATTPSRYVIYADEWHPSLPNGSIPTGTTAAVTHVNLAFAASNNTRGFVPKYDLATWRQNFPSARFGVAIGGWGDTSGFSQAVQGGDAGIQKWAQDVAAMVHGGGYDGVDIDWEYPGGNGADYKQVPNAQKTAEIAAFPKLLKAVRTAMGKGKDLSIAVPGKKQDMIAFTPQTAPQIWDAVDMVNVMAYDLMNRRDSITAHHSSVKGAEQAVKNYLALGLPADKVNLGFAWYAKYFATKGDCSRSPPLGCPIMQAEDPITGQDTLTSGAYTFETGNMRAFDGQNLPVSHDGTCGAVAGKRCATGCCSQYGMCGVSKEHCGGACQHAFGTGCTGKDVAGSWQLAAKNGVEDREAGGQYYFDRQNQLFWTWDTPATISRKFDDIVHRYKLGGVMAWSLGEDSFDWSHVEGLAAGVKRLSGAAPTTSNDKQTYVNYDNGTASQQEGIPDPTPPTAGSITKPAKSSYSVVYVDGIGGPEAEGSETLTPLNNPPKEEYTPSLAAKKNAVVPVSGSPGGSNKVKKNNKTTSKAPGPNDDWEWVWYDQNGKPWKDRKQAKGRGRKPLRENKRVRGSV